MGCNLDLSKASGPDIVPVVFLKNCELELSYILAELFNKCLKESCFPDCWMVSSVVPIFKACVCYFLTNFCLSSNDSPSKTAKDVFYFI